MPDLREARDVVGWLEELRKALGDAYDACCAERADEVLLYLGIWHARARIARDELQRILDEQEKDTSVTMANGTTITLRGDNSSPMSGISTETTP